MSFWGIFPFCVVCVDDILVFSPNLMQHLKGIKRVLQILEENGLVVKEGKCEWAKTRVEFLGHQISPDGIKPLPAKVKAVTDFPTPITIKAVQEFSGLINCYHRFIPSVAKIMSPIYNCLKGKPQKLCWSNIHDSSFLLAKQAVTSADTLIFPLPHMSLTLTTDASSTAMGAVVEQDTGDGCRLLEIFSKKLTAAERKYSMFDRELLAVHKAIRHFHHMIEGWQFVMQMDHQPLVHARTKTTDAWSARQQCHLSAIAEHSWTIKYLRDLQTL